MRKVVEKLRLSYAFKQPAWVFILDQLAGKDDGRRVQNEDTETYKDPQWNYQVGNSTSYSLKHWKTGQKYNWWAWLFRLSSA